MPKKKIAEEEIIRVRGAAICGAIKKNGEACRGKAMTNGRCRLHGGKSLAGSVHPSYKTGRYSKYMPTNLKAMYDESISSPNQLELGDEVGLLDSRIADRLQALENKDAANATWKELQGMWKQFMFAVRSGNQEQQQLLLGELNTFIGRGSTQADIWYELTNLIESRRKLVDSEGRRLEVKQNIVTVEQAFGLVNAMVGILKEVVYRHADPQIARKILIDASVEHKKLIGAGSNTE